MSKVIVYIASSLDGYIARKDDDVSWLDPYQTADEDYGYHDFIRTAGTAIMGARSYEQYLKHPDWMLKGQKNYILSSRTMPVPPEVEAEFYNMPIRLVHQS